MYITYKLQHIIMIVLVLGKDRYYIFSVPAPFPPKLVFGSGTCTSKIGSRFPSTSIPILEKVHYILIINNEVVNLLKLDNFCFI